MLRSISKQSGNTWSQSGRRKGGKDLQKRKVLSLEWKSEEVMDDESGELMELVEELLLKELFLFLFFSRPRSQGWPHHGHTFSIYPCPLSF